MNKPAPHATVARTVAIPNDAQYAANDLQMLEGTRFSRFLMPLEYLPSRNYTARWGYSRPLIPSLVSLIESQASEYLGLLTAAAANLPQLMNIPRQFNHASLPAPGFLGVAMNPLDTIMLYTMVKARRPRVYLEIGSGISTCFVRRAISDNALSTRIISIDPTPRAQVDQICDQVFREGLETVDLEIFNDLQAGDFVFIDGSHRSFMNSDVTVFMIDVLPLLRPGVIIHLHDITLPWDYHEYFKNWYWNEQYILAVYLMSQAQNINIILPLFWMYQSRRFESEVDELLAKLNLPLGGGGSFWFTKNR